MNSILPPIATQHPHSLIYHGDERIDPYYWLRDDTRSNPEVLDYLHAENGYTEAMLRPTEALQKTLYQEMVDRQLPDDSSVPYYLKGYWYRSRYLPEQEYPLYERLAARPDAPTELLLDGNERAAEVDFYDLGALEISPSNHWMACSEDVVSRRQYQVSVRNLQTGEWLVDRIENTSGDIVWSADSAGFFYVRLDEETLLPYQVWYHKLGSETAQDKLVYEEADNTYYLHISHSRSEEYLLISLSSTLSTEVHLLSLNTPQGTPTVFLARRRGHEYGVDHFQQHFYVRSNREGRNFALYQATDGAEQYWQCLLPVRDAILLQDFLLFRNALFVEEREAGLTCLRQLDLQGQEVRTIAVDDPAYVLWIGTNPDPENTEFRYGYASLTTPTTHYALDIASGERKMLKRQPVLGDFKPEDYQSQRLWITARDGTHVPVSLVYRKDQYQPGQNPLLVYGYGAYGLSEDPYFASSRLSLLDRGFIFAIAHVRGGEELGRHWYEQGRQLSKMNSFTDFIDVTDGILAAGYGDPKRVFATGGSAGGLLMGAVINMAPERYLGVVAVVPFVDTLTSMLDESIPLTTGEYDEWGDPRDPAVYQYIKSYSPYDQVKAQAYPHLLVVSGLHDSQVQYWEPAKWIAKLRKYKTDDNLLLLSMDMDAGHGGKSGRYRYFLDISLEYAFMLALADTGINSTSI